MSKVVDEKLQMYRHGMAHVLAKALKELYPDVKLTIGPAIEDGFYYDIDMPHSIVLEDYKAIEDKMQEIIKRDEDFVRKEISKSEALELFKDNEYKCEIINELPTDEVISIYYLGNDFVDLCRGPHVENTKYFRGFAFKINRVSGAYWRGDAKNKMLQRVYVYGFMDKSQLKEHIAMLEEAKKRDHRKLGKELKLFFISDYAQGMPFFMPNGLIVINELINYWREVHIRNGYKEIVTPMAMNRKLWEASGHWEHYKKNMYTFSVEDDTFAIKPMNCPGGMLYYMTDIHSYKDFPLRVGELGKVHRHEASGTLNGLFRVRCFTQDDAHIFMTPSQVEGEVGNVLKLIDEMYTTFGLSYHIELSTMPEDHIGDVKDWEYAENSLKKALEHLGKDYVINEGDGAFYGPKIDIHIKDALNRTWQCGTIQLDMQLPKRFNLEYVDEDGTKKEPVMIHRVVYGSLERFFGMLIENYAGAFPTWLAPVQVKVLTINESCNEYANSVINTMRSAGIRVEFDTRNETIGKKIREAQMEKVPYTIVIGEHEVANKNITYRKRGEGDKGAISTTEFVNMLCDEIKNRR